MKLIHLFWVLGLAVGITACAAWIDEQPIQGCLGDDFNPDSGECIDDDAPPPPPTGGSNGAGGGDGACTNPDDAMVYANLEYTDSRGNEVSGPDAASAIASDCVFGSTSSDPPIQPGCGGPAGNVIACAVAMNCSQETIDELTNCVVDCSQENIEAISGGTLSDDCIACYGDSVSCSAELCAASGCSNPTSSSCIQCRCDEDCTPGFDRCSGLPPSGACG